MLRGPAHRLDDVHVARAAADLPGYRLPDLFIAGIGVAVEQGAGREDHARRAEPALEAVLLHEALLDRVELAVALHVLDRADYVAAGHGGEHGAGLDGLPVHQDHAGAAVARVAAPVRARQPQLVTQEVHEQQARLDLPHDLLTVDGHRYLHGVLLSPRALDGAAQRPLGQLRGQMPLVIRGAALIVRRGAVLGGPPGRFLEQLLRRLLTPQRRLRALGVDRARADRRQPHTGVRDRAVLQPHGGSGRCDRPVAGPPLDLLVGAAGPLAKRQPQLYKQLRVAHRRLVRAEVEVAHLHDALAAGAADHRLCVYRRADGG